MIRLYQVVTNFNLIYFKKGLLSEEEIKRILENADDNNNSNRNST